MELTNEQYGQACRYVDGEMTEKEAAFFEALMSRDETLRTEVEALKEIKNLCASAVQKLEERLDAVTGKKITDPQVWNMLTQARKEWEENKVEDEVKDGVEEVKEDGLVKRSGQKRPFSLSGWTWLVAATIVGLVCITAVFYFQKKEGPQPVVVHQTENQTPVASAKKEDTATRADNGHHQDPLSANKEVATQRQATAETRKLFAAYFKPDDAPDTGEKLLTEPVALYKEKKYAEAAEAFDFAKNALSLRSQGGAGNHTRFYVHYYLAQSRLASDNQSGKAITGLQDALAAAKTQNFRSKAQWYLALALLKKGNTAQAIKYLSDLTTTDNDYRQKATELLTQLNEN